MTASLHGSRLGDRLRALSGGDGRVPGQAWRLSGAELIPDPDTAAPVDVAAVPCEAVLVLAVDLPLPTRKQRLAALPFAIEDRIADPLDQVHIALGAAIGGARYLAGVTRHATMKTWLAACEDAGLGRIALIPDALLLPVPPEGAWSVRVEGARSLVRCADATGFAVPIGRLATAWAAAGSPACILLGGTLPDAMQGGSVPTLVPDAATAGLPLDLRQGAYAARQRSLPPAARRIFTAAAAGALAHAAIAMADTAAVHGIAIQKERDARSVAARVVPGIAPTDDLVRTAVARLPADPAQRPDRFMPLLGRVSSALVAAGPFGIGSMAYDGARDILTIDVPAGNESRIAGLLAASGLQVRQGRGRILVAGGAA